MDWPPSGMDRLYELYQQDFHQLRAAVIDANRSHGSQNPEKTWMELLTRDQFGQLLTDPKDPAVAERWIKELVGGHEDEFPGLLVA